eukprot:TRINITY_DN7795_c0_g1_i3.p1 TRINITY_DN7795_c0_g1~~TRINITY_DN7795_c0_g1_i3.p1  ORF type:complete len:638 (-),score=166.91 TRINITY_DN7795_c0_g1_i3:150-2063(-)
MSTTLKKQTNVSKSQISKNQIRSTVHERVGEEEAEESFEIVEKNKDHIEEIKKANANLKEELNAEIKQNHLINVVSSSKIEKLQELGNIYAKKIEIEQKRQNDLLREIEITKSAMQERQSSHMNADGVDAGTLQKKIKLLDHKLEKTLQRHNQALAQIRELEEEINSLRRDRVIYDNVYKKLEKELKLKESELQRCIKKSMEIQAQYEESKSKLKEVKKKIKREQTHLDREYQRIIDGLDNNLSSSMNMEDSVRYASQKNVGTDRRSDDILITEKQGVRDSGRREPSVTRIVTNTAKVVAPEDLSPTEKRGTKGKASNVNDLRNASLEVERYQKAIDKIRAETNISDLDELVNLYNNHEEHNNKLYTLVNGLSDEIDRLEMEIANTRAEISKFSQSRKSNSDGSDNKVLLEMKMQLQEQEEVYAKNVKKDEELGQTLTVLREGVQGLFEKLGIPKDSLNPALIEEGAVNDQNVLAYLQVIEQRLTQVLDLCDALEEKIPTQMEYRANVDTFDDDHDHESRVEPQVNKKLLDLLEEAKNDKEQEKILDVKDLEKYSEQKIQELRSKRAKNHANTVVDTQRQREDCVTFISLLSNQYKRQPCILKRFTIRLLMIALTCPYACVHSFPILVFFLLPSPIH